MISPARILKFVTACAALLATSAWIAPASAQECKSERFTIKGRTITAVKVQDNLDGRGDAMRFAIQEWEREVAAKVGEQWNQWESAKDSDWSCEAEGTGVLAKRRIACRISARPCQVRDGEDKNGDDRKEGERTVEREEDRDGKERRRRWTDRGRRDRDRDRDWDRDWDRGRDRDWHRDRERNRYRWGAYDYDGRYVGHGPQYYGGYRHRRYGDDHHRHYGRRHRHHGGYDHYPRTWIPRHLCGEAQLLLHECGYGVAPDSYCGYRTSRAISRFQYRQGLRPSGYPNESTMAALINSCGRRR